MKASRFLSIVYNPMWECWRSEVQLGNDVNCLCTNYSLLLNASLYGRQSGKIRGNLPSLRRGARTKDRHTERYLWIPQITGLAAGRHSVPPPPHSLIASNVLRSWDCSAAVGVFRGLRGGPTGWPCRPQAALTNWVYLPPPSINSSVGSIRKNSFRAASKSCLIAPNSYSLTWDLGRTLTTPPIQPIAPTLRLSRAMVSQPQKTPSRSPQRRSSSVMRCISPVLSLT